MPKPLTNLGASLVSIGVQGIDASDVHYLPMYMGARWPEAAAWRTTPMMLIAPAPQMRTGLRPYRSAAVAASREPTKHPACRMLTMFALRLARWMSLACSSVSLYSLPC